MALSKPYLAAHLRILNPLPRPFPPGVRLRFSTPPFRLLSFATPEEAAAERRRRKRRLRIEPPLSSHRQQPAPRRLPSSKNPNPNAPKLPESATALAGNRLNLHNRILTLIRENDLDEASLLVRHSIYSNCRPTIFTCNAVLAALLRQCRYTDLLSLHRFITQASVAPTVITHNLLLQAYCDCRKIDNALEHYRLIVKEDVPLNPSPTTYRILVKGLVDNNKLEQAVDLKNDMLDKALSPPDPIVYNLLMTGFVRNDEHDRVLELFEELKDKLSIAAGDVIHDGIVYGNLMKGYFKKGMDEEAMDLYSRVLGQDSNVRFSAVSYNSVLDALAKSGRLDDAVVLFERMMREHDSPKRIAVNLGSFNVMVDGFCSSGRFGEAIQVFRKRLRETNCVPDVLSYNNLIGQLGKNGLIAEAEELFEEMGERGFNPDEYTFVLLVESYFGAGRPSDAIDCFNKMVDSGLRPNANAYNQAIGGLADVRRLDEARGFFDRMVEREVKPNVASYEILLQAYCRDERVDDALRVLKDLLMDESVSLSQDMKELVESTLRKESREEDFGKLLEDVTREKAEAAARAAEEKERAEALAREEEERVKAEKAAKEAAAARASAAAIEAVLGRKRLADAKDEGDDSSSPILSLGAAETKSESVDSAEEEGVILESSSADEKDGAAVAAEHEERCTRLCHTPLLR
ncbi:Pentatricopeptide repeat-containing protein [Platanthera zijinensis]|uniref:Pentatricopeptide repeat-containing protein n=1 Tax=Platanthera zijinensis TaxID=2320716 RepID=A0AAP0BD23_9ASPA